MEFVATLSKGRKRGVLTDSHAWGVPLPIRKLVAENTVDIKRKLLLLSGVHEQAEANQDNQQVDICGLIPGFVHRVVYRLGLVPQKSVSTH